jgi:hypothetical protein
MDPVLVQMLVLVLGWEPDITVDYYLKKTLSILFQKENIDDKFFNFFLVISQTKSLPRSAASTGSMQEGHVKDLNKNHCTYTVP